MAKSSRFILVIDADGKPARQEISKLTDSVKEADSETKQFGKGGQLDGLIDDMGDVDLSVRGVTNALTGKGGATVAALGLAGGLFAAAKSAADAAVEVDVLATALNTDVETASRLATVFERVGIETNDIADIGLQISGALSDDVELAGKLGLTLGQAKDPVTALKAGIDNWDFMTATERASVFGEEGVRQISAIVAEGGDLQTMLDEVGEANVFTAEDAAEARELNLQIAKMEEEFKGLALSIGKEVIPAVADFTEGLREVVGGPAGKGWAGWGKEVGGFFKDYGEAIYNPLYAFGELKDAVTGAGDEIKEVGTITDELRQRIEAVGPASKRAIKAEASRWQALADDATEALDAVDAKLEESRTGALADWKNELEIEDQAERLEAAMTAAFGGTKKEVRNAKDEAIRFLESIEDLPAETILDVRADFDEGSLASAYSALDAIRREAGLPIPLGRYVPPTQYGPGPDGGPAFTSTPAAATNLTVNMPRSASPRSVGATVDEWRRVNG